MGVSGHSAGETKLMTNTNHKTTLTPTGFLMEGDSAH